MRRCTPIEKGIGNGYIRSKYTDGVGNLCAVFKALNHFLDFAAGLVNLQFDVAVIHGLFGNHFNDIVSLAVLHGWTFVGVLKILVVNGENVVGSDALVVHLVIFLGYFLVFLVVGPNKLAVAINFLACIIQLVLVAFQPHSACAVGAFALGSGGGNRECTFNGGVAFVQLAHLLQNGGGFGITLSRQGCSGSKQQHGKAAEDRFSHFGLRI